MKCSVGACVNVYRIGRNLDGRNRIVKHSGAGAKNPPIRLINAVTTLATINTSEVEGAVDVGIRMGEIYVPTEWKEFMTQCICFGGIGRADEMGVRR